MNIGNLQSNAGRLQDALDVLLQRWEKTRELWKDERSERLEEEFLRPLKEELMVTLPAVSLMAQTIGHARRQLDE